MRVAALAAALAGAAFLPDPAPGAGVVLVAVLVGLTVLLAARPTGARLLYGAIGLGLVAQALILDAPWVVALDLLAAAALAAVAVCGPRLASLVAPIARLGDAGQLLPAAPGRTGPALRGGVLGVLVVVPFAALFWQADAAFAQLGGSIPVPRSDLLLGRAFVFGLVLAAAIGLALAARRPYGKAIPRPARKLAPWEWAVPLALLDALFLVFVVVQLAVLFGGHDRVLETTGLTYAEYAREGFWQLLAASALTLAVIGAASLVADTPRRAHRRLLLALAGVLCALTLVVLASALQRLWLYEEAFGLTRLRLGAEAFALWLGGVFVLVAAAGLFLPVRRRLAHVAVAGSALALLGFSLANPDRLIAERNVERWRETGDVDASYLSTLSADAVPVLVDLPAELDVLADIRWRLRDDEPWSSFNVSRDRARELLGLDS